MPDGGAMSPCVTNLTELVRRGVSGELICASDAVEVHVHLQAGRIAWATDSLHAFLFTRYLQEHASVSKEQFREVVEECRRNHLRLGETLVAWKLVTMEQVRAALAHQIRGALAELATMDQAQRVFLPRARAYQQYASEFTFDLSEFGVELLRKPSRNGSVATPGLVHQIRKAAGDVTWIELLEGSTSIDSDPPSADARVPAAVVGLTLLDEAQLVTLRTARGTLAGVLLRGQRTLWCRVAAGSTFGSAVSALCAAGDFSAMPVPGVAPGESQRWTCGNASDLTRELGELLERAADLAAVVVAKPDGELVGVGCGDISEEYCKDLIRRRSPVFSVAADVFADDQPGDLGDLEELGFRYRSIATAEQDAWCVGAQLGAMSASTAWVFVRRSANAGLGWAYMSTLTRRLEALPRHTS